MKSPWKIIGKLFSDRRGPQAAHDLVDNGAGSPATAREAPKETEPSQISVGAFVEPSAYETDVEAVKVPEAGGEPSEPVPIADDPVKAMPATKPRPARAGKDPKPIVSDAASKTAAKSSRPEARVSRTSSKPVSRKAGISAADQRRLIQPLDTFEAEVAGVDADVRALSRQLAEKLRQQNAQLRKMLERFAGA